MVAHMSVTEQNGARERSSISSGTRYPDYVAGSFADWMLSRAEKEKCVGANHCRSI